MKIILMEDVKELGHKGEVVEASEGYVRNFLFPQHFAVEASEEALRALREKEKAQGRREKKQENEEKKLATSLEGREFVITAKTDHGKLYGSIGKKEVASALKKAGFAISEEWITFAPQKEVGSAEALVSFPSGFEAAVTIVIEDNP
ncbi:MAG: 50S ribosomal protein L9 [Patescibacteria group bacterium]